MSRISIIVTAFCAWLFICTVSYGICMVSGMAYYWSAIPIAVSAFFLFRFLQAVPQQPSDRDRGNYLSALLLGCGLLLILDGATANLAKHGHWDAWWFWNLRAKFLTYPDHWRVAFDGDTRGTAFSTPVVHADYPPFLPLLNGMSWSWLHRQPSIVPYLWGVLALLFCSSVLFLELAGRNLVVAAAALFFLAWQQHFIELGTGQTADIWIGLFVLLAVVAGNAAVKSANDRYWAAAGLMLGCAMWTKNEGVLIAACFAFVSADQILRKAARFRNFVLGLLLPVLAWAAFKIFIAPSNDIVSGFAHELGEKLKDSGRYLAIWNLPRDQIRLYYPALPWLLLAAGLAWAFMRTAPSRYVWMLLLIWLGYCTTYLVSPHDIGWHINTSADRLVGHLYPSLIYIVGLQCCRIRFKIGEGGDSLRI